MGRPRYAAFERETLAFLEELADNKSYLIGSISVIRRQ